MADATSMAKPVRKRSSLGSSATVLYTDDHPRQAEMLGRLGATDAEIATFLRVDGATLAAWRSAHPAFAEALARGADAADALVERRLFERATGYSFEAVKVLQRGGEAVVVPYTEHLPPDMRAIQFWLTNRRPERWSERPDRASGGDGSLVVTWLGEITPEASGEP
jgi:hypothetical protein